MKDKNMQDNLIQIPEKILEAMWQKLKEAKEREAKLVRALRLCAQDYKGALVDLNTLKSLSDFSTASFHPKNIEHEARSDELKRRIELIESTLSELGIPEVQDV
jgi:hypothetical protein